MCDNSVRDNSTSVYREREINHNSVCDNSTSVYVYRERERERLIGEMENLKFQKQEDLHSLLQEV